MTRQRGGRLTALEVDGLGPGLHSDTGNLYLRVKPDGRRSWTFIYRSPVTGKQREAGLGRAGKGRDTVSLAKARDMADEGRALLRQRPPIDPLDVWGQRSGRAKTAAPPSVPTFEQAAKTYIDLRRTGQRQIGAFYKRMRPAKDGRDVSGERTQRLEVRFDGVAGCLRVGSTGGSSVQNLLIADGASVRSRRLSAREAARLMGLADTYRLPSDYLQAYDVMGDAVVVPVVRHLAEHVLEPIVQATALRTAAE
jgi:hypothetical protein